MIRYKKAICLVLIFTLSLSLFVVPAGAVEPISIAALGAAAAVVAIVEYLTPYAQQAGAWMKDQFISTFIGTDLTGIEIGDGDYAAGYVFKAYREDKVYTPGTSVLVSFESLSQLTLTLNSYGISCTLTTNTVRTTDGIKTYWFVTPHSEDIIRQANLQGGTTNGKVWLCNQSGYPYHAEAATDNTTSTNTNYNYYTQEGSPTTNNEYNYNSGDTVNNPIFKYGDEITENNQVYDYSSDSYVDVGDISYDASTKQYTTNITIDNSVHVQYNIDHTSITYIGSSAEDKTYNLYYELPDGRNSADLTAEDLEQLVLNYDVINYGVSADDGRLRALYHFDGNLEDSSYWSNYSSWDWSSGASVTYLETVAFGGALYLDESAHNFTITLPDNFSNGDFTILFRYYHTASSDSNPGNDFSLATGSNILLTVTNGTSTTSNVPVGQWNELGIIRDGSVFYVYLNGVVLSYAPITGVFGNTLIFNFLSGAVTRQLDELRVYNYALYQGGIDYTPTSVPVDTNAVLILPDEATPVPDAYWEFNTEGNLLEYQNFTTGLDLDMLVEQDYYTDSNAGVSAYKFDNNPEIGQFYTYDDGLKYDIHPDFVTFYRESGSFSSSYLWHSSYPVFSLPATLAGYYNVGQNKFGTIGSNQFPASYAVLGCFMNPSSSSSLPSSLNPYNLQYGDRVSFSVITDDGSHYVVSLNLPTVEQINSGVTIATNIDSSPPNFTLALAFRPAQFGIYSGYALQVIFSPDTNGVDVVYMEFKKGDYNTGHKYVTEIYSDLDLTGPAIAIRSQIPIREYRIGGVRPTVPYRGDVWLMVENSHITSAQIYTGYAWLEVDCRIWTGQRWVSSLYYNILTQQDYTDILGTTDNEYIQSTEGFYSWLTKQFKELLDILNTISDQLEDIDSGGGTSLDFTFEIDGGTTVEFTKLADDGKVGMLRVVEPLYDILFAEAGTIYEGILAEFTALFDTHNSSVTIDGNDYYSVWYVFTAEPEVWNDATAA